MSHPKDKAIMVKHLAQGYKCHDQDLNPLSADQKHQSLSPVLLTARPRHATVLSRVLLRMSYILQCMMTLRSSQRHSRSRKFRHGLTWLLYNFPKDTMPITEPCPIQRAQFRCATDCSILHLSSPIPGDSFIFKTFMISWRNFFFLHNVFSLLLFCH